MASLSCRFLWVVLFCYFRIDEVVLSSTEVELEVLLTRFSNRQNRNALNQCCDGKKDALTCTESCDIFFVACVSTNSAPACKTSGVILRKGSEFISSQENFTFSSGNTVENFMSFTDPQGFIEFSISFYDDDSSTGLPDLENKSSFEAVINHTERLPAPNKYISIHRNISRNNMSFEFLFRLKCAKNYYWFTFGGCDKYCKPKNNLFGHYECLSNGTRSCLPGWKGPIPCTTPICPDDCSGNGLCHKPKVCSCNNGWRGPSCSECIPPSNCVHATCTDPHVGGCSCKKNWTGQHCNVHLTYCSHFHPCKNGRCSNDHTNNFTCSCYSGWSGRKCDKFLCSASCNLTNAVCTSRSKCSCKAGWTGPNCNQCISTSNCTHGYCNVPFECLCTEGWSGENCTVKKSSCSPQNPCQNDGSCIEVANGSYHCECKTGFTGRHCQDKEGWSGENCTVEKSSCGPQNPCQNDGSCIEVANGNYHCECKTGFTGRHCQDKVLCSKWCNESRGYCEDNECKCRAGWQGPNCTECIKNSSCVHGYCQQPFECICEENWSGPICNCTNECAPGITQKIASSKSISGNDTELSKGTEKWIYILSSIMFLLIITCLIYITWRQHRTRASFHVSSLGEVFANNFRPSYKTGKGEIVFTLKQRENGFSLNNNVSAKPDYASCGVVLNPMTLQPSQNSRSMLINNE